MQNNQFWRKSYDAGLTDIDPSEFETSYTAACVETFRKFPAKIALAFMGAHITFAELDRYSNRFANMLLANGFKKGDVVGINLPNIPEYVIAWLGTLKAGCVVSGVSPLLSPDEMEYQLKDLHAKGLVTLDAIYAGRLVKIARNLPDLKLVAVTNVGAFMPSVKRVLGKLLKKIPTGEVTPIEGKKVVWIGDTVRKGGFSAKPCGVDVKPDDVAYIQYTGGTTGLPKGAMLSHRNAVSDLLIVQRWLSWEKGKGLALSGFPFFHIAGLFFNANCIYLGWTQVLIPNPRDTSHICKEIARYKPTALVNVPSLFLMLIENPMFKTLDFSKLEVCISAASPFPEEAQKKLEAIVGKGKLLEVYGMTETSPLTVMNPMKGVKKLGSIGLPLINTGLCLKEPGTGRVVEQGEPGEICVKGPQVMLGYFNKPEESREVMDADGYLHTGDVAFQDDEGYLRIVDRTKDMLIVGGFKVFSRKVEDVLAEHPAIGSIALIGVPNPERPGSEIVIAYVTLPPNFDTGGGEEAVKKSILDLAAEKLSPYEVPKRIEIRKELPLTPIGKIDKKVLRKEAREASRKGEG